MVICSTSEHGGVAAVEKDGWVCDRGASAAGIKPPLYASVSLLRSEAWVLFYCPRHEYMENPKRGLNNASSPPKTCMSHMHQSFLRPLDTRGPSQMKPGQQDETSAFCQSTKPEPKSRLLLLAGCLVPGSLTASKSDQPTSPCAVPANLDPSRDSFAQQSANKHR